MTEFQSWLGTLMALTAMVLLAGGAACATHYGIGFGLAVVLGIAIQITTCAYWYITGKQLRQ